MKLLTQATLSLTVSALLASAIAVAETTAGESSNDNEYSAPDHSMEFTANFDDLGMDISSAEREAIVSAIQSAQQISKIAETRNGRPFRRDAHAKATGCVRANFTVNGDIPARFQHSVFTEPGREYQAWIRFSNGSMLVKPDSAPDARGMAIKLLGVAENAQGRNREAIAPELYQKDKDPLTHDLIMTNTPAFFNRNIFEYSESISYFARFDTTGWFFNLWPPRFHLKQFYRAKQTISTKIDNPLNAQYFSMLPYQLGNTSLKFSARPCPGVQYPAAGNKENPDFLTQQMAQTLDQGAACFDFLVQPKIPGAYMPMDDATVIWPENASPFIPIARVHIPPQTFTGEPQSQFCENLSMNPWHGVGDWTPQGSLNRGRRLVYNAVSKFRHAQNQVSRREPADLCIPGSEEPCTPQQGLVVNKPRWPLPRCFDWRFKPNNGELTPASQCDAAPDEVSVYSKK